MSIKRTLVMILVIIFLATALLQAGLVFYFKNQIESEIKTNSTRVSQQILTDTKNKVEQSLRKIKIDGGAQSFQFEYLIEENDTPSDSSAQTQTTIHQNKPDEIIAHSVDNNVRVYHSKQLAAEDVKAIFLAVDELDKPLHSFSIATQEVFKSTSFAQFTSLILWVIAGSTLIAITFAIWFATRLTKPISTLIQGMHQLDQNKLGTQITPHGVGEIKTCMEQFNVMSQTLAEYEKEKDQLKQQKHLAELGELSRGIAHALRNPVHTLGLVLNQYWQAPLDEQASLKQIAQTKINHIDKNICALLSIAKSQVSRTQSIPLCAVLNDIKLELHHEHPDIAITCDNTIKLCGLESEVRSILHALVVNAVEASQHSPITIEVITNDHDISVSVADKGCGIPAHIRQQLFSAHVSDKPDGAGLGLYLAQQLITLYYDGEIRVVASDETGTQMQAIFGKQ